MKTNQNLIRKMGEFEVTQRTEDGMFNATELLKQWNQSTGMKKEVSKYFENPSSKEFIHTILQKEFSNDLIINNTQKSPISKVYVSRRGLMNGGTWMHPLLFIDFAMWINPSFKYDVLKFVYDELIKYRNEAGDAYRKMCEGISKISDKKEVSLNIQTTAKALNYICFGTHEPMIRNKQDESAMKELVDLEKYISNLIADNVISEWKSLYRFLVKKYNEKRTPQVFQHQLQ